MINREDFKLITQQFVNEIEYCTDDLSELYMPDDDDHNQFKIKQANWNQEENDWLYGRTKKRNGNFLKVWRRFQAPMKAKLKCETCGKNWTSSCCIIEFNFKEFNKEEENGQYDIKLFVKAYKQ